MSEMQALKELRGTFFGSHIHFWITGKIVDLNILNLTHTMTYLSPPV